MAPVTAILDPACGSMADFQNIFQKDCCSTYKMKYQLAFSPHVALLRHVARGAT